MPMLRSEPDGSSCSTTAGGADIIAFASSQGLFAGASLEGSYLDPDNDWNALYSGLSLAQR